MSRFFSRCVLVAFLLVTGLSLPAPASAVQARTHGRAPQGVVQEQPGLLQLLWNALSSIWGKDGVRIDPHG